MRVLHLSDLHLRRSPGPDHRGVDARAVLDRLLADCRRVEDVDLVVVSGDVTDDGSREGCADALARVGAYARTHGAAVAFCPGNHDDRSAFAAVLGTGHGGADGAVAGRPGPDGTCAAVSEVAGVRVVTLDSLVPGRVPGLLGGAQLDWLAALLAEAAPAGSVVVLHHPPVAATHAQRVAGLQDADALAGVLRGSDVRAVLCGHFHAQVSGRLAGVPVLVGPGTYSRLDLTAPPGVDRAVRGAAAAVVDLGAPTAPLVHVLHARDPRAGELLYVVPPGEDA